LLYQQKDLLKKLILFAETGLLNLQIV